uniref:Ovule protein n=1 Tax=Heterorhabditis bacteriophora TaxID=37862 RepID=A0A1I7WTN9_HETBA
MYINCELYLRYLFHVLCDRSVQYCLMLSNSQLVTLMKNNMSNNKTTTFYITLNQLSEIFKMLLSLSLHNVDDLNFRCPN